MPRLLWIVSAAVLLVVSAVAQATTPVKRKLQLRGGATLYEYVLPNQLTLIVIEKPDAPLTSVYHWVKAGSLNEKPGITGIAHLFEHMMFRPLMPGERTFFAQAYELGASVNASTRFESTVYNSTVPANNLPQLLKLEAARFKNLKVTDELLDVERQAVRSEYQTKQDTSPEAAQASAIYSQAFVGHPLGWYITGFRADLDKIKAADCNEFFSRFYRPNNVGVIVGGAVSAPEVLRIVEANYGDWQPGPQVASPAAFTSKGAVIAEAPLASPARSVLFGFRVPLYSSLDPQVVSLANWILFESPDSLARRRLVIDQHLAADMGGAGFSYTNAMLQGGGNLLPDISIGQLQTEVGKLASDFQRLGDAEYRAYMRQYLIDSQESARRNEALVVGAALNWGKYGNVLYLQRLLAGSTAPDLRSKLKDFFGAYVTADNLVIAHGKGDK